MIIIVLSGDILCDKYACIQRDMRLNLNVFYICQMHTSSTHCDMCQTTETISLGTPSERIHRPLIH